MNRYLVICATVAFAAAIFCGYQLVALKLGIDVSQFPACEWFSGKCPTDVVRASHGYIEVALVATFTGVVALGWAWTRRHEERHA